MGTHDATDLNFRVSGSTSAPAVMLLHALGANLGFWDAMIAEMGSEFRIARFDQRGHGHSPVPPHKWTMDEHVADVEQVRKAAMIERMTIVGTAVGGVIALFYAHRYPERVKSVIFVNPTMGAHPVTNTERAAKVMAGGMQAIAEAAVARAFGELAHDERYVHYRDEILMKTDPLGYQRTIMGLIEKDIRAIAGEIRRPVLLLAGRLDTINRADVVDEIAGMLPNASVQWVERGAHFAPYQAPAACADAVRAFVRATDRDTET
ncbi:alpha/beta fold hydrolase [Bosea sp. (in: a-proteobacteria)]|uniref:alpha/beta fold hydrolase n=1 Tax=Bosea sp. (in: a-proteobacteria) TaxID=1871050 RepID=UPI00262FB0EC|nr:alpha/beta fold hydrolase [Bosea sp. (in: a-proteobacteria)]MCO5090100.1 alpha/beta hydrolase [Bosea sp. (in: a-proteobacteria)]